MALTDPSYRRCYHVSIEPPCGVMGTQTEVLAASQAEADEKVTRMLLTWLRHWAGQDGAGYAWSISNGARTVASGVIDRRGDAAETAVIHSAGVHGQPDAEADEHQP